MDSTTCRFGEYQLEEERRRLLRNGEPITLSSRSFDLLVCLVKNAGKLVSRDDLFGAVWGNNSNTNDEVLTDAMSKLRGALRDDEKPYKIIETIHRKGYQFIANIETGGSANEETFHTEEFSGDAPVDRSPAFEVWLGRSGIKWWFAVILLGTIGLSIFYGRNSNDAFLYASVAHLVLVLVSLAYYHFLQFKEFRAFTDDLETKDRLKREVLEATKHENVDEWLETRRNAEDVFAYITTYWQILLIIWLVLYGLLGYQVFYSEGSYTLKQAITAVNNCNSLMLVLCFFALNRLEKIKGQSKWYKDTKWLIGIVVIVGLIVVEGICINNYAEIGRRLGNDLKAEDVLWFFRVISGLCGAIVMALFVGRLQSKFFNPPAKLITALYAYTAIQPLFVFFDDESKSMPFITALVIHIALILKCLMVLYLFWTFETGRLLFYLVRVRLTNKEIENEWEYFQTVLDKNTSENSNDQR
jgi:DNA-binding winged helix-turn-helix (wHTH) protein